jgi:accessory gene regulator protein AgrB
MLVTVAILLLLFELWYMLAYLYAYTQTQERLLLAPALQGLVMSIAVTLVVLAMLQIIPFNGWLVLALFVGALLLSLLWRTGINKTPLAQSYPRGVADILSFRRPAADLKRRVRSK